MIVWIASEAYQQENDENEISSYAVAFKTKEEAEEQVLKWIRERVSEHYDGDDETTEEDIDNIVNEIRESHDGHNWWRWVNNYEHFAWNITISEI